MTPEGKALKELSEVCSKDPELESAFWDMMAIVMNPDFDIQEKDMAMSTFEELTKTLTGQ